MNKIKDYDSSCGDCPLMDWCGEPYELPYLCKDSRFEKMTAVEYISIAETIKVDDEIEGTSAYKEVISDKVYETINSVDKNEIAKELDYWKREAIKNAAELGEIKIKQKPMKPKDVRGMRNFFNAIYMYRGLCQCGYELTSDFFYCNKCGQKLDWSV